MATHPLPGRLGNPDETLATDPRTDPRLVAAITPIGLDGHGDPLRDEGLAYYRKLLAAGVDTVGRIVPGTCHAGDLVFEHALPDVFAASVRDLVGFAESV